MVTKFVKRSNQFRYKKGGAYGKKKRWYFGASANLPIVGKTSIGFGSGKAKRAIINTVRRGLEDPQHKLWSKPGNGPPDTVMSHNTIYTLNLTGNINKGDDEDNRTGETIHLEALKFRVHFTSVSGQVTNGNRPKTFRVMIVKHDGDHLGGFDVFGGGLGSTDLFQGNTNPVFEWPNPKNVTVLYDNKVKITPVINTEQYEKECSDILKLNTPFTYKSDQNYGKTWNLYLVIMGYEPSGTTGTTTIGRAYFHGDLIFKDSR